MPSPYPVLDTAALFHAPLTAHYAKLEQEEQAKWRAPLSNTYNRRYAQTHGRKRKNGDVYLRQVEDLFLHGMGVSWSSTQIKIFHAFINACLPRIYGKDWEHVKGRVMEERGLTEVRQEILVSLGRRNGKTWVTAATVAALILIVPDMDVAVFSVGERQARMLMATALDRLEGAFNLATHVKREDYHVLEKNKETLILQHPDGGKQVLGCYPGSVR